MSIRQHIPLIVAALLLCVVHLSSSLSSPTTVVTSTTLRASAKLKKIISPNQEQLEAKKFPRTWVPIASTFELDPGRPTPIEFLGQKYVTYQDNSQRWVVFDDACPHRRVPLSEGRVDRETNTLQCSYHGWEFDSSGTCTRIPQLNTDIASKVLSSTRSCVPAYPTAVEKNILWVWPWKDDVMSIVGNPNAHPEGMMKGIADGDENAITTYTRDLPYGWESLVENLIDPAHVPFAHHGLQGKRTDAIPINMTIPTDHGENGFSFEWQDRTMGNYREGTGEFRAPYIVNYDAMFKTEEPRPFKLAAICIPTKPGWSRAIIVNGGSSPSPRDVESRGQNDLAVNDDKDRMKSTKNKKKKKNSIMGILFSKIPTWLVHQLSNRFLDSDLAFLHYQEQERQRRPDYYMLSQSDRCINALRKWIPTYTDIRSDTLPPPLPRSAMFDRWSQHTSHCKQCQAGLAQIKNWRRSIYAVLALSVVGFQFRVAKVSTLLCLGMIRLLQKLENSFKEGEFKHYENH